MGLLTDLLGDGNATLPIVATGLAEGDDIIVADTAVIEESASGAFRIVSTSAASSPLVVRAAASQTAPVAVVQQSSGATALRMWDDGTIDANEKSRGRVVITNSGVEVFSRDNASHAVRLRHGAQTKFEAGVSGIAFFGVSAATQRSHPGTASGSDAAVINAIRDALINYGLLAAS